MLPQISLNKQSRCTEFVSHLPHSLPPYLRTFTSYVVTIVIQQNRTAIVKPYCQTNNQSPFYQELRRVISSMRLMLMVRDQKLQVTSCSGRLRLEHRPISRRYTDSLVFVFSSLQIERLYLKCDAAVRMFSEFSAHLLFVIQHYITCRANKTSLNKLKEDSS